MTPDDIINLCMRKGEQAKALHLNVRITGQDATVYEQLRTLTPTLKDSQRVRDSVRVSTYLLATKDPVLTKLGVFK